MATKKTAKKAASNKTIKWSAKVDTESTFPEEGLFKKGAITIAKSLASPKVSPKGPASGMRMLNFYINRAGHNLPESRHKVLERAKEILSGIIASQKEDTSPDKPKRAVSKSAKKSAPKITEVKSLLAKKGSPSCHLD